MPRPRLRKSDVRRSIRFLHPACYRDQHAPNYRIELPPTLCAWFAWCGPPSSPIRHHRRPIAAFHHWNVSGKLAPVALRYAKRKLAHQFHHTAVPKVLLLDPRRPLVMAERKVYFPATHARETVQIIPVESPRPRKSARQPNTVPEKLEAKFLTEQVVVALQLFRMARQLQLMKVKFLFEIRGPPTNMPGVKCSCEFPCPHQPSSAFILLHS